MLLRLSLPLLFLFTLTSARATNQYSLEELVAHPDFEVVITATGTYGNRSVELQIRSEHNRDVEVFLPAGMVFRTDDPGDQPLLIVEDQMIAIAKKGYRKKILNGYCMAASNSIPEAESTMQFGMTENVKLQQLADFLKANKGYEDHAIQEAVWCVSDQNTLSYIFSEDMEKGKLLTEFVAELTGQEVPWHQVRRRLGESDGYVQAEPVLVSGLAEFTPVRPTTVRCKVLDAEGNTIYSMEHETTIPKAMHARIKFSLSVTGWDAGTYRVLYYDQEDTVLLEKEFEI